jgi:basic membrane lipoprotein Med (substrate-binding protein (PBP1-ABC) superfamily)
MPTALTTTPPRSGRRIAIIAAFGASALGILAAVLLLNTEPDHPDVSSHFKTCLLTSANSPDTDRVWRGVQASTGAGSINAQKLVVPNDATTEAGPYFASLIASQCRLIVADGQTFSADLQAVASTNPATKFVNVGTPVNLPNVRNIPSPVTEPSRITEEVLAAQRAAG